MVLEGFMVLARNNTYLHKVSMDAGSGVKLKCRQNLKKALI